MRPKTDECEASLVLQSIFKLGTPVISSQIKKLKLPYKTKPEGSSSRVLESICVWARPEKILLNQV